MLSQYDAEIIHEQNVADNQASALIDPGASDGIPAKVAEEMGYHVLEDIPGLAELPELPAEPAEVVALDTYANGVKRARRARQSSSSHPAKIYEMPGIKSGHVNPHDQPPTGKDVNLGATEEERQEQRAVNAMGFMSARSVLGPILERKKDS